VKSIGKGKNPKGKGKKPVKQDSNTLKWLKECIQTQKPSSEDSKQANSKSSQAWRNCQAATGAFQGLGRVVCEQLAPIGMTVTLKRVPVKFAMPK